MQYRLLRKKYKSLIISFILHGLLFLALLYYTFLHVVHKNPELLSQEMPAPVSFQSRPQRQKRILPLESSTTEPQDDSLPYGEQLEQVNTLELPYQEPPSPETSPEESSEEILENLPLVSQQTPQGTFPQQEISTVDIVKAFRKAVLQERPPTAINDPQSFVQQRLGRQWGQASYSSRVAQSLNRSFRVHARTIRHSEMVNRRIRLDVTILKDGTPGDLGNQPLSGIEAVDKHIRYVVQQADFPPIPERFNQETYQLSISIQIVLKDGAIMFGKHFEVTEH